MWFGGKKVNMKKERCKRLCSVMLALILSLTALSAFALSAKENDSQEEENQVTAEYHLPTSLKVGQRIFDLPENQQEVVLHNLQPGKLVQMQWEDWPTYSKYFTGHGTFGLTFEVDKNGTVTFPSRFQAAICFYEPGTITFRPAYAYVESEMENATEFTATGDVFTLEIEAPVIQTNAPKSIQVGSTLHLQTALTNTALPNKDTAYYLDPDNYEHYVDSMGNEGMELIEDGEHVRHEPAYQPRVEILEGADLVEQTNQDYSNTLTSTEDLTFKGT